MLIIIVVIFLMILSLANTKFRSDYEAETELRIGGIFHDMEEEIAFRVASSILNGRDSEFPFRLIPTSVSKTHSFNTFEVLSDVCHLLEKGVIAILGPSDIFSSRYINAVLDNKEVPQIEVHWDSKIKRNNCILNLHPHPAVLCSIISDIVAKYRWDSILVLYEDDQSLFRVGPLFSLYTKFGRIVSLKQLKSVGTRNYRDMLSALKKTHHKNFVIDCSIDILEQVLKQAQQVGIMTENYNYILTNLDMHTTDVEQFQYSGANITGIRIIDPNDTHVIEMTNRIHDFNVQLGIDDKNSTPPAVMKLKTALIIDAVTLFYETIKDLTYAGDLIIDTKPLHCNRTDNLVNGYTVINYMKVKLTKGLTGIIKFDSEGFRRDFALDIIELTKQGVVKIGTWNLLHKLKISRPPVPTEPIIEEGSLFNRTFVVITCLTEPYGMRKETTDQLLGNDRYEGYGIDLIKELAQMLGFNYTIVIEEDGNNGSQDPVTKEWNGLIGEINKGNADLAIADLTVTADRERAVDFTLPFMSLGISILYRKPEPVPPSLFMFASPFSVSVWAMMAVAYLLVSLALFVMGRLSPSEWNNPYPWIEEPEYLVNQFSIRNSFWFTIASLMQQGSEIAPAGISTRTASGIWWFFTLIMVSSYTANLAAFLTVETFVTSFNNIDELAAQDEIQYGAKRDGATAHFFRDGPNNSVRWKVWNYMSSHPELMTNSNEEGVYMVENNNYAFFMESTTIEYVTERHCSLAKVNGHLDEKGYAIAMRKGSAYRNDLSTAILKMQESGRLTALKNKWWKEKRGAGNCVATEESEATPLDLKNVGGVFLVLFVGSLLGFVLGIGEMILRIYRRSKHRKVNFKQELKQEVGFLVRIKNNIKIVSSNDHQTNDNKLL